MHSIGDLVQRVQQSGLTHVVLTGGEPLLPNDSIQLASALREAGLHLTIETGGHDRP